MRMTLLAVAFVLLVPANPVTAAPAKAPKAKLAPAAVIAELYDRHDHNRGPFFQSEHRDRVDHFFVKDLADLIWKDTTESDGVGALDFDPLYFAQDTDIKNFKIEPAVIEGRRAHVTVTFDNYDTKTEILYSFEQENGTWKISDIRWDEETTLRALLRPDGAASPQ